MCLPWFVKAHGQRTGDFMLIGPSRHPRNYQCHGLPSLVSATWSFGITKYESRRPACTKKQEPIAARTKRHQAPRGRGTTHQEAQRTKRHHVPRGRRSALCTHARTDGNTGAHWVVLERTGLCWSALGSAGVHWVVLELTGTCCSALGCAGVPGSCKPRTREPLQTEDEEASAMLEQGSHSL